MKKIFIASFICMIAVCVSCAKNDQPINPNDLPAAAKQFLNKYFSTYSISYVERDHNSYEVTLNNGYGIDFDKSGNWTSVDCKQDEIPSGIVPAQIVNYVSSNYTGCFIVDIEHNRGYDVELNNGLDLEFDKDGKFVRIDD